MLGLITSKGRAATSGAHVSDVKDNPVWTKIVLTWIKNIIYINFKL